MATVLRFDRRAADRDGPLLGLIAPERLAGVFGPGLPRPALDALIASPRVGRRVASLVRQRLGLGPRQAMTPRVAGFLADHPRTQLTGAALRLGLATWLKGQGPMLLKTDLRRLAEELGSPVVAGALELVGRMPAVEGLTQDRPSLETEGFRLMRCWAEDRFGDDAPLLLLAFPPDGETAPRRDVDPAVVDRALRQAGGAG